MSKIKLNDSAKVHTYWGHVASVVGLLPPRPLSGDLCPGDNLEPLPDISVAKLERADSVGIEQATHVANLVGPQLQRQDSALEEGTDEVFGPKLALILQLPNVLVYQLNLAILVSRVVVPVASVSRGTEHIPRQIQHVDVLAAVLHIESGLEPLFHRP